jgi:hypothetical protein
MGNKDARRREVKKPKKKKPAVQTFTSASVRMARPVVAAPDPPGDNKPS